jgi:hypothetical protein
VIPTTKRARPVFPFRSPAGGEQPSFPACRAWRIIARPAADFAAGQPAVDARAVPAAPAGCADGVYPVWVRLTDTGGQQIDAPILVDGDGWNLSPTGPNWTIEFIGEAGAAGTRFAYVVEIVQDVDECGQVNTAAAAPTTYGVETHVLPVGFTFPILTDGVELEPFVKPAWGPRSAAVWCDSGLGDMYANLDGPTEFMMKRPYPPGAGAHELAHLQLDASGWKPFQTGAGRDASNVMGHATCLATYGTGSNFANANFQMGPNHPEVPSPPPSAIHMRARGSVVVRHVINRPLHIWCEWWS